MNFAAERGPVTPANLAHSRRTRRLAHVLLGCALGLAAQAEPELPASPEAGGPRNLEVTGVSRIVNVREEASRTAPVVTTFALGTVLDNLGCTRGEEGGWCDVQPLGGGARGFVAVEYLTPAISPDGSVATGPDDSALRAGEGRFDATGEIPCAEFAGQPMNRCTFGVARAGGGYATVVITRPSAHTRTIFFRMGRAIGADGSEAEGYPAFRASRERDLNFIRVGDERYEIPDAVVLGG